MPVGTAPTVVWTPNLEVLMLLANLTDQGPRITPKAVSAMRRAALLKFDGHRRSVAVSETSRLLADGFWLDALCELGLAAEAFPKAGFAYDLSPDTARRAAGGEEADGVARLERYLEYAAAFTLDTGALDFLKLQAEAYRAASADLESALGDGHWSEAVDMYFGRSHRSLVHVASLLMPAGYGFGFSLPTPGGPMAFHVTGPFLAMDGKLTFADPELAVLSAERELIRAFVRPVVLGGRLQARPFVHAFHRARDAFLSLGYEDAMTCLEDHLVHGIHGRLLVRRGEAPVAESLVRFDEAAGYAFARPVLEALEDFETHRTDFPTLDLFFPHLIEYVTGGR
jgi:hypothetical protein